MLPLLDIRVLRWLLTNFSVMYSFAPISFFLVLFTFSFFQSSTIFDKVWNMSQIILCISTYVTFLLDAAKLISRFDKILVLFFKTVNVSAVYVYLYWGLRVQDQPITNFESALHSICLIAQTKLSKDLMLMLWRLILMKNGTELILVTVFPKWSDGNLVWTKHFERPVVHSDDLL